MENGKVQNDPWSPLPQKTGISQPPVDPRYQLIDSDRYIASLETKLKRIKGKHRPEPSSRDIIDSLTCFRDDQMRRFLDREQAVPNPTTTFTDTHTSVSSGSMTYLQRRLHPERQALNMEELFELLKDDELARIRNEEEEDSGDVSEVVSSTVNGCERVNGEWSSKQGDGGGSDESGQDWKPFDKLNSKKCDGNASEERDTDWKPFDNLDSKKCDGNASEESGQDWKPFDDLNSKKCDGNASEESGQDWKPFDDLNSKKCDGNASEESGQDWKPFDDLNSKQCEKDSAAESVTPELSGTQREPSCSDDPSESVKTSETE